MVSRGETGTGAVKLRYCYHADGLRVEKTGSGATGSLLPRWVSEPNGNVVLERGGELSAGVSVRRGKAAGVLGKPRSSRAEVLHAEGLGEERVSTTDESGVEMSNHNYLAFGTEVEAEGTAETVALYTGKEWDGESGLYYNCF